VHASPRFEGHALPRYNSQPSERGRLQAFPALHVWTVFEKLCRDFRLRPCDPGACRRQLVSGRAIGATDATEGSVGEVVFNTAMTGYQEILTDPSYAGQIVTLTYPQ